MVIDRSNWRQNVIRRTRFGSGYFLILRRERQSIMYIRNISICRNNAIQVMNCTTNFASCIIKCFVAQQNDGSVNQKCAPEYLCAAINFHEKNPWISQLSRIRRRRRANRKHFLFTTTERPMFQTHYSRRCPSIDLRGRKRIPRPLSSRKIHRWKWQTH